MCRQNIHGAWYLFFVFLYGPMYCFEESENCDTNDNYLCDGIKLFEVFTDFFLVFEEDM